MLIAAPEARSCVYWRFTDVSRCKQGAIGKISLPANSITNVSDLAALELPTGENVESSIYSVVRWM